jgi:hypothetical protein
MIITARQPRARGNPSLTAPPRRRMIREKGLEQTSSLFRRETVMSKAPSLPSRSPVGLVRLRAHWHRQRRQPIGWLQGSGRHGAFGLQNETGTLESGSRLLFMSETTSRFPCAYVLAQKLVPSLIGSGSGPRCVTRLENLFMRKRASQLRSPYPSYTASDRRCLEDKLRDARGFASRPAEQSLSRRAAKLERGLDPDLQWPHDAMSRCLKVGEFSRRLPVDDSYW